MPLLVNPDHLMPDDYSPTVVSVGGNYKLESKAAAAWQDMQAAASRDGVPLWIISAYRTLERQTELYQEKVEEYKNLGYNEGDAKIEAGKWVAVPGTSEHCLGYAADLCSLEENFENSDQFAWLQKHCAEYGFILRYPTDKTRKTGIIFEPWHYRYVGKEAAREIMEQGICLEEYLGREVTLAPYPGEMGALGAALAVKQEVEAHGYANGRCSSFIGFDAVEQFRYVRESGVSHCEIETEFDNALLREDGYDPMKFFTASHIKPSRQRAEVVAPFYEGVTVDETLAAMKGMISVHHMLQAANPVKRWVVLAGMRAAGKYEFMHGLVANPQPNPKCVQSSRKLEELYKTAVPLAVRLIGEYAGGKPLGPEYQHTFGED